MKKFFKWFFVLTGVLLALSALIFGFGVWAAYETGKRLDIGYGASTSPRLVRLEIGDKVFAIPENHISSREDWKGGRVQAVILRAVLPGFEPYTEANQHEFDKPGAIRAISLLLREHNIPGSRSTRTSMTRREVYERLLYDYVSQRKRMVKDFPAPYGLALQRVQGSSDDDGLYVGHKRDGTFYWARCSLDGAVKFPSCGTNVEFSKHTTIRYHFSKSLLSDWQAIDDGVLNLIRHFEANARQGE